MWSRDEMGGAGCKRSGRARGEEMSLEASEPGIGQRLGVGKPSSWGDTLEQQPVLCPKAVQDSSSAGAQRESFWAPFLSSCPF